ncbi:MAG: ribosome biogenesis GTP-binding protein YihA/YsxC [Candidatus Wallbacteria bacterium]|nr:ribosome biogenesis GTP-binding protein YihA/YsxC [Candidatus Wallbacteria bacterium]
MKGFNAVDFLLSAYKPEQFPKPEVPEAAFIGRSNVGKSSLLNLLCGHSAARVSKSPGRTQAINFFRADGMLLADLPGYGYAKVSQELRKSWGALIEGYLANRSNLRIVVWIVDSRRKPDSFDDMLRDWLTHNNLHYILVINKIDKIPKNLISREASAIVSSFPGVRYVLSSTKTGKGGDEVMKLIRESRG